MEKSNWPVAAKAVACALALLLSLAAQAREILDLDVATQPAQLVDWGDWVIDNSGAATVAQVLAQPERLKPTLPQSGYPVEPGQALWIRFTVPAAPDQQRWYVRLADPALDEVRLYTRRSDETWSLQSAGDSVAVSAWALPHLHPVLPLVVSAADPTHYLLRIRATDGVDVPVEFVSESWLSWEQQRLSVLYGIYFGLLAMGAIFSLSMSAVQRDASQMWFGLWTAVTLLAAATAAGVAGLHLWGESPRWSDAAHHVLPAAATAPFMMFVLRALSVRERAERFYWPCVVLALAALGFAALCGFAPSPARRWLAQGTVGVVATAACTIALWSWQRGDQLARRILGAFVPFAATLVVYALRGWVVPPVANRALVILLAGLAITICATWLVLASHMQTRRASHRRIARLHEVDPLTGLPNDTVFAARLDELVTRAQRFGHQNVVAIVEFTNFNNLRNEFGRKHSVELLLRQAERLNALVRTVDTVARLGDARFGLLVDGPIASTRAKALCAKVIAHCITPMAGLPLGMIVKPRIAIALVPLHGTRAAHVLAALDAMLHDAASDSTRVILVPPLPEATASQSPSSSVLGTDLGFETPMSEIYDLPTEFPATAIPAEMAETADQSL